MVESEQMQGSGDGEDEAEWSAAIRTAEDDLGEESRKSRIMRRPMAPTKEMVEEHNRTHAEYRDWCPHCRAGKSTNLHHRQGDPEDEKLGTTISVDYALSLKEEQVEDLIPILVAYDNVNKSVWTLEVEEKGISNSGAAVDWLIEKLGMSGYRGVPIALNSDIEPSILAFKNAIAIKRQCETSLIDAPVRESESNAHVERAIRTWRDQIRTQRHYTERRLKKRMPRDSALMSWLVSWASEVLNRYKVQANGRTSFEMATLHKCRHKVVAFAEKVHFQHTYAGKEEDRKDVGVFVGMMDRSQIYLIANDSGAFGSPNIAAFPDEQAFDPEMALSVTVKHHQFLDHGVKSPPGLRVVPPVVAAPEVANPDPEPVPTAGEDMCRGE